MTDEDEFHRGWEAGYEAAVSDIRKIVTDPVTRLIDLYLQQDVSNPAEVYRLGRIKDAITVAILTSAVSSPNAQGGEGQDES